MCLFEGFKRFFRCIQVLPVDGQLFPQERSPGFAENLQVLLFEKLYELIHHHRGNLRGPVLE
ncbi:MAG: hypothetical protein GTO08_00165 [Deltaproteobacteria bacterium]|nr:hypothetical protein [Deltaproteobacteria bacterium]